MEQEKGSVGTARAYYSATFEDFLKASDADIFSALNHATGYPIEGEQRGAWEVQLPILRDLAKSLGGEGGMALEFSVPRFGRRIDCVLLYSGIVFALEFKTGAEEFLRGDEEQAWDYALDLKNFHEPSHIRVVVPVLVATEAKVEPGANTFGAADDLVLDPVRANKTTLLKAVREVERRFGVGPRIPIDDWLAGLYRPTPSIIEAARALYSRHSVDELARADAGVRNLTQTSRAIKRVIDSAQKRQQKAIVFVTGVPGAGKTLVGLEVANKHLRRHRHEHGVYLSGNGPLVEVLTEALTRDHLAEEEKKGAKLRKGEARKKVETFIQNVHHFRDDCVKSDPNPPVEHVTIFDEAQRAWNVYKTADFMKRRKKISNFGRSEPEYLVSCLDRHPDWAVIVCLVGEGQEINTGEAGISEWLRAIEGVFPKWNVHASQHLMNETATKPLLKQLQDRQRVSYDDDLHLKVSLRSFRAENLSEFVRCLLEVDAHGARAAYKRMRKRYPIILTRDVDKAKAWVRSKARGTERFGMVVSSQAQRLKPFAIDVRAPTDPVHWFLDDKRDTRSSFYLEDVATEFHVQGLELDWTCMVWDADLRFEGGRWHHRSFSGDRWKNILQPERKQYLENAYRVLLTRARQGMVIVVPRGSKQDQTRSPEIYDGTYAYLKTVGLPELV